MSATNGEDKPAKAADDQHGAAPQNNFERLISHLDKDSLAAKFVSVYAEPGDATPADAVGKVVIDRLEELKHSYDKPQGQQN